MFYKKIGIYNHKKFNCDKKLHKITIYHMEIL